MHKAEFFKDHNHTYLLSLKILQNQTYKMIVNICYLAINGLIHSESSGNVKVMEFIDDQLMSSLYEKFLLNYFKKEHPQIKTHLLKLTGKLMKELIFFFQR